MSKKILEKFFTIHKPCSYCYAGILRDILHYYDHNVSENLLFGYMGGINFFYTYPDVNMPGQVPIFWIAGDPGADPRDILCRTAGVYQDIGKTDDPELGWEIVKDRINRNQPVMIDVAFTSYYVSCLKVPLLVKQAKSSIGNNSFIDFEIGGQKAAIIGYDLDEDIAYLVDVMVPQINKIPLSVLKRARNEQCYMPPQNEWSVYYVPKELMPLKNAVRESISLTVHNMLNVFKFNDHIYSGLYGMKKFIEELPGWQDMASEKTIRQSAFYMFSLGWYTGRGFFRSFYSNFLKEASEILNEPGLIPLSGKYRELSHLWGKISKAAGITAFEYKQGLFEKGTLSLLNEVLQKETDAIHELKNIADSWNSYASNN